MAISILNNSNSKVSVRKLGKKIGVSKNTANHLITRIKNVEEKEKVLICNISQEIFGSLE